MSKKGKKNEKYIRDILLITAVLELTKVIIEIIRDIIQ